MPPYILPVFAGMIPTAPTTVPKTHDSPRIRGDDPYTYTTDETLEAFSPYSRG